MRRSSGRSSFVIRIVYGPPIAYIPQVGLAGLRERDPAPSVAVHRVHRVGGHARSRHARSGARDSAEHGLRGAVSRSLVDHLPGVQRRSRDTRGAGAVAPLGLVRLLGLEEDSRGDVREEAKARIPAAEAARRLDELVEEGWVRPDTAERVRGLYSFRSNRFRARLDEWDDGEIEERSLAYQRLRRELLDAERGAVLALRNEGRISEDVMQRVQRDLDLEDSRLDVE